MQLSAEKLAVIDEHLFAGSAILAIREYRRFTGAQLNEAKTFVDERLEYLHRTQASQFQTSAPQSLTSPDPGLLRKIIPLPDEALHDFRKTLKQIDTLLYGINYSTILTVNAASIPASDLPINELMLALFPKSNPSNAKILRVTSDELMEDVTECLKREDDVSPGSRLPDTLIAEYWRQLNLLAPLNSSSLYYYDSEVGIPGYYVFWKFAYLIHHPAANRCVVITGKASD